MNRDNWTEAWLNPETGEWFPFSDDDVPLVRFVRADTVVDREGVQTLAEAARRYVDETDDMGIPISAVHAKADLLTAIAAYEKETT